MLSLGLLIGMYRRDNKIYTRWKKHCLNWLSCSTTYVHLMVFVKCVANSTFQQMGVLVEQQDPIISTVEDTAKQVHQDTERA